MLYALATTFRGVRNLFKPLLAAFRSTAGSKEKKISNEMD